MSDPAILESELTLRDRVLSSFVPLRAISTVRSGLCAFRPAAMTVSLWVAARVTQLSGTLQMRPAYHSSPLITGFKLQYFVASLDFSDNRNSGYLGTLVF